LTTNAVVQIVDAQETTSAVMRALTRMSIAA